MKGFVEENFTKVTRLTCQTQKYMQKNAQTWLSLHMLDFFFLKGRLISYIWVLSITFSVKHQLLEAVSSLFIFLVSFAEVLYVSSLVCSKVQIVTRIAQSAQVQQIMMYRRSHIAISPSPPNLPSRGLTKRRKSIVCLCIDQLRLIESWTVRDLRNDVILLSHL